MNDSLSAPVRVQSLVDTIVERLEGAIMGGELAPGARLSEQALAKSLGVSRGPLREAIRRLEGRKLIQRTPNIGPRVASLSPQDLHDLLVVREALEGMACRLAAELMTDQELDALAGLLAQHGKQDSIRKGVGYYQETKDFDFHFRIIKASRNERLIAMLCGDLYDLLRVYRYKSSTLAGRAKQAFAEHQKIVAALKARDPGRAEATMREHLRNARAYAEKSLKAAAQPSTEPEPQGSVGGRPG